MQRPCRRVDTTRVTSPNGAFRWLHSKPLNATTGQVITPYWPGGCRSRRHRRPMKTQRHIQSFSSLVSYFFTCSLHQYRDPKQTPYSAHRSNERSRWKSGNACRARAQLAGVSGGEINFFGRSKINGRYAPIVVKLLTLTVRLRIIVLCCYSSVPKLFVFFDIQTVPIFLILIPN